MKEGGGEWKEEGWGGGGKWGGEKPTLKLRYSE